MPMLGSYLIPRSICSANTKAKVSCFGKIASSQFIFFHLETFLQNFFSFGSSYSAMNSNLFITPDTKGSNSVSSFGEDRCLTSKSLQHFTSTHKSVTTFTNTNVDA